MGWVDNRVNFHCCRGKGKHSDFEISFGWKQEFFSTAFPSLSFYFSSCYFFHLLFCFAIPHGGSFSRVASFLVWGLGGGGGKTPKCTDKKNVTYMSERLKNIYIFRSQNTYTYTSNAVPFYFL